MFTERQAKLQNNSKINFFYHFFSYFYFVEKRKKNINLHYIKLNCVLSIDVNEIWLVYPIKLD